MDKQQYSLSGTLKHFDSKFEEELGRFTIKVLRVREEKVHFCRKHRIDTGSWPKMTPQEELFVKFFNQTALEIKDLNDIELQAYREELSLIALKARAKQTAVIEEDENRKKKRGRKLTELEQRSITTDETTTDAINAINRRSAKLSKMDKVKKTLIEMGMPEAEADQIISARTVAEGKRVVPSDEQKREIIEEVRVPSRSFVNPFEKKDNSKHPFVSSYGNVDYCQICGEHRDNERHKDDNGALVMVGNNDKPKTPTISVNPFEKKEN